MHRHTRLIASVALAFIAMSTAISPCLADRKKYASRQNSSSSALVNGDTVNSGRNIFSDPEDALPTSPSFRRPTDARGRLRQMIETETNKFPTLEQVRQIPTITGQQRKEINKIYEASKLVVQPMLQELRDLRQKAATEEVQQFAEGRPGHELLQRIQQHRQETWDKVKALLTEAQLEQLDQMRRGELLTGLNAPMTPPGLNPNPFAKFRPTGIMAPPAGTTIAPVDAN